METYSLSFLPVAATPEAATELSAMARQTFADTFRHYTADDLESYLGERLSPAALATELQASENYFYFILCNEVRVGYLKWIYPSTKYLDVLPGNWQNPFLLERLYFLPEYLGRGLGSVALAFVESWAKHQAGADILYLSVWDRNYRAQAFYQKHGFQTVASFEYPVGEEIDHELLYAKCLNSRATVKTASP